ncbi:MAG: hypothetical protein CL672_04295 [Balneola sp.]|nr:hypothetical protein [Balneola sp.]|tara:strand:- start:3984 stop:4481 length:498 start_codon:yes stop_codon:yes gene_type:complete
MLNLKTYQIPLSKSNWTLTIPQDFLESEKIVLLKGILSLDINRSDHMIHIKSMVTSSLELQCDRSLDTYIYESQCNLEIIYKEGLKEEKIDLHSSIKKLEKHQQIIEFDQEVRDMLLLSLPIKRIHPRYLDDYGNPKELLNVQFGTNNTENSIDPRWYALKNIKN